VPGAVHAPHHPTPEWIKKISDMHLFDEGWNKLRDTIFANQKRLGVISQDAKLTPWHDLLKNWDELSADEKKMFIRQADVFAAYFAYTDHEIGRVIDEIDRMGKLDNTLIIYIAGDNGNSAEGSLVGTPNEVASLQGVDVPVDVQLKDFTMTSRAQTRPIRTWPWRGHGRSTRRSPGPSKSLRTSVACAKAWRSRGLRSSRTGVVSATSSPM
jgi:arylsulfatase